MVLFTYLVHDRCDALFFLVTICILFDSTKNLTIRLQVKLIEDKFRHLALENKLIVRVEVKLALPLFVFSIMGNLQVVLVRSLELLLLQSFVALLSRQLFATQLDEVVG